VIPRGAGGSFSGFGLATWSCVHYAEGGFIFRFRLAAYPPFWVADCPGCAPPAEEAVGCRRKRLTQPPCRRVAVFSCGRPLPRIISMEWKNLSSRQSVVPAGVRHLIPAAAT